MTHTLNLGLHVGCMAGNSFFATTTGSANNAFHVVFCFVKCACAARSVRSCSGILRFMSLPSNSHRRRHSHYYRRQAWQCFCGDPLVRSFILLSNCLEMNDAKMLKRFPCFSFYGIRFLLLRPLFKFVFIRWHSKTKFLFVCEKASFSPLSFTQWWRWSSGQAAEAGSCIGAGASIVDGSVVHSTVSLTSLIITLWLVVGCLCCRCSCCCCCCMPVSHSLPWGENLVAASYCNCSRWFPRCGF